MAKYLILQNNRPLESLGASALSHAIGVSIRRFIDRDVKNLTVEVRGDEVVISPVKADASGSEDDKKSRLGASGGTSAAAHSIVIRPAPTFIRSTVAKHEVVVKRPAGQPPKTGWYSPRANFSFLPETPSLKMNQYILIWTDILGNEVERSEPSYFQKNKITSPMTPSYALLATLDLRPPKDAVAVYAFGCYRLSGVRVTKLLGARFFGNALLTRYMSETW